MAFVGQTRMVANPWIRPGNTADSSSCKAFMQETFNEALKGKRGMYPNVKNAVWGLDHWVNLTKGIDLNEMVFSHLDGKPRRYIVVRKKIQDRPRQVANPCSMNCQGTGSVVMSPIWIFPWIRYGTFTIPGLTVKTG